MRIIEIIGDSMIPTLQPGNYILTRSFDINKIQRGKIILFVNDNKTLIKRIVGLPKEFITYDSGHILINDEKVKEDYLPSPRIRKQQSYHWKLQDDEVIVLGDNPNNSLDSRKLGPIKLKNISNVALFKIWPPGRI